MATQIVSTNPTFNNLHLDDFPCLIDLGPLAGGYRLVKHPALIGYGIANEAAQVAFWDSANKPFLTLGDVDRWLESRPVAAPSVALANLAAFDAAFIDGGEPTTRRDFLKQAAGLFGLAITAPMLPPVAPGEVSPPWGDEEHPLDKFYRLKALGEAIDPARAALIDQWCERMEALNTLAYDLAYALDNVRCTEPADVDAKPMLDALQALQHAIETLASDLEQQEAADLVEAVTGRSEGCAWVERCIRNGDNWGDDETPAENARLWLVEIEATIKDHPEEQARLMGAYNTRFGRAS